MRLRLTRRDFLRITGASVAGATVLGSAGCVFGSDQGGASGAATTVRLGRIPAAQAMIPITEVMREEGLIEQAGEELGLNISAEWQDFPQGAAIRQALTSGQLDFGTVGNTPTLIGIAQNEPIRILSMAEGRVKFVIAMPVDSSIRTPEDLQDKRVGLIQASDLQFFFDQTINSLFGTTSYDELGIEVVGLETLSQTASPPGGIDAVVATETSYLRGQLDGLITGLINSYGFTEEHYDGPLGEGAGIQLPEVQDSPYYPEGFYLHRNFWLVTESMADENPDAVVAFLIAEQRAVERLQEMDPTEVAALAQDQEYWNLDPEVGRQIWLNDLIHVRGWPWLTRGDLRAVVDQSELAAQSDLIDSPLSWERIIENISPVAPLAQQAWETIGYPEEAAFTATNTEDVRGLPLWQYEEWETA
jgi:ABC-type nitrate/sulfonate/bicarbonate transport system substrate-binding protein